MSEPHEKLVIFENEESQVRIFKVLQKFYPSECQNILIKKPKTYLE